MSDIKYKVRPLKDDTWQVVEVAEDNDEVAVYQGDLANCEAYIRLSEKNYF